MRGWIGGEIPGTRLAVRTGPASRLRLWTECAPTSYGNGVRSSSLAGEQVRSRGLASTTSCPTGWRGTTGSFNNEHHPYCFNAKPRGCLLRLMTTEKQRRDQFFFISTPGRSHAWRRNSCESKLLQLQLSLHRRPEPKPQIWGCNTAAPYVNVMPHWP